MFDQFSEGNIFNLPVQQFFFLLFTFLLSKHLFFYSLFWDFEVGFCHVTLLTWYLDQSGFKLVVVLLFQSPLCLDCRCDRPCLTFILFIYFCGRRWLPCCIHNQETENDGSWYSDHFLLSIQFRASTNGTITHTRSGWDFPYLLNSHWRPPKIHPDLCFHGSSKFCHMDDKD